MLMQIVSGAYGLYYQPRGASVRTCIGHTDKEGVSLRITKHGQQIQTALTGDTVCDILQTGGSITLHMNLLEAGNNVLRKLLFDNTTVVNGAPDEGLLHSLTKPMGRLASSFGGSFWALPLEGTTAAGTWAAQALPANNSEGYNGFKFAIVTPDNGQDIIYALNAYARIIPVVLRALPYVTGTGSNAQIRNFEWVREYAPLTDFNFAPAP